MVGDSVVGDSVVGDSVVGEFVVGESVVCGGKFRGWQVRGGKFRSWFICWHLSRLACGWLAGCGLACGGLCRS